MMRTPARMRLRGFIDRYVFPDGELHEVGSVVSRMQRAGLEARHVEGLREHYALTLRAWVRNLEAAWPRLGVLRPIVHLGGFATLPGTQHYGRRTSGSCCIRKKRGDRNRLPKGRIRRFIGTLPQRLATTGHQ
jgi:hypothetical protein